MACLPASASSPLGEVELGAAREKPGNRARPFTAAGVPHGLPRLHAHAVVAALSQHRSARSSGTRDAVVREPDAVVLTRTARPLLGAPLREIVNARVNGGVVGVVEAGWLGWLGHALCKRGMPGLPVTTAPDAEVFDMAETATRLRV